MRKEKEIPLRDTSKIGNSSRIPNLASETGALSRGVFYFFPGPVFKKPQSPGKAKKDYLPTQKRHEINRFTVDAAVNLN